MQLRQSQFLGVMKEGPLPRLVQTSQPEFWSI
jgi:hypothetical protein